MGRIAIRCNRCRMRYIVGRAVGADAGRRLVPHPPNLRSPTAMMRRVLLLVLLMGAAAAPATATAQVLRVTVTDSATGAPVRDARVRLVGQDGASVRTVFSSERGVASTRLPAGTYTLRVQRAGYHPVEQPLRVSSGANALAVALRERPLGLDTVLVVVPGREERGRDAFRRRSETENGVFLDPEYFVSRYRGALWVGDLMLGAPGVITPMEPRTGRRIVVNARQWNCFNVLLNGEPYNGPGPIDNWVRPRDLVGVEMYHSRRRCRASSSATAGRTSSAARSRAG